MDDIRVSVIIPIYRVEAYLRQCVDSVLGQTYANLEVILVDDGSPDRCPAICDEYAYKDSRIVVIHKKNGGSSSARKAGVERATGEYVMFVDGDDWLSLETIRKCMETIYRDDRIECVLFSYVKEMPDRSLPMHVMDGFQIFDRDAVKNKIYRRLFGLLNQELNHPERMENIVSCCMKLYKADLARKGRFFDTEMVGSCEDGLFNMYALDDCKFAVYLDQPFYHYRKAGSSITSSYRPKLEQQWNRLFNIMENIISEKNLGGEYKEALDNRIALSITAVGLNELGAQHGTWENIKIIRNYLYQDRYHAACKKMCLKYMPISWKILMSCCKLRLAFPVWIAIRFIATIK